MRLPRRVVCLVPSLTETIFDLGRGDCLVGVSDYCEPPREVPAIARVGGPKTPDHAAITALNADLVILGEEECCRSDFDLFTQSRDVYVASCRSLADGLDVIRELGERLGVAEAARAIVTRIEAACGRAARQGTDRLIDVFYPLWPEPWITVSAGTFAADMLRRAGARSIFDDLPQAYPTVALVEVCRRDPELLLLPDEPYPFGAGDAQRFHGLGAVRRGAVCCVPGRWAAWYGSRMDEGLSGLRRAIGAHAR